MQDYKFPLGTSEKSVKTMILADVCRVSVRFAVRTCRWRSKVTESGTCLLSRRLGPKMLNNVPHVTTVNFHTSAVNAT